MKKIERLGMALLCIAVFTQCKGSEEAADSSNSAPPQNAQKQQQGPPNVDELFAKMDMNKDGQLSMEEVQGPLKNDFSKVDANGDGFLSKAEIEAAPKPNRGQQPPRQ